MPIRLLIADDHAVVRAGVSSFVRESDITIVAEASDGAQALLLAQHHRPDVVLLDVRMPEIDGMACLSKLKAELPQIAVVIFTAYENPTYVARAVALGAAGYLVKNASQAELVAAVHQVAN